MAGLSFNPDFSDVLSSLYVAGRKTISTSQVLAAASTSNQTGRQTLFIYNTSSTVTVYFGPSGLSSSTTGIPIEPTSSVRMDVSDAVSVYLLTASGSADVVIHEVG